MSDACKTCQSGDCSSCASAANGQRPAEPEHIALQYNNVKNAIAIVSGKGGVGKSSVTSMLSVLMRRKGYDVGVLDADITGPSMAKVFGLEGKKATGSSVGILPLKTKTGLDIMSINLLLKNSDDPVVWRGPVLASAVTQFWADVLWGDKDYMFVDMPPGTGDVPLTVFQQIPVKGIIIVTSPQDLVSMIVKKSYKMAKMMNIPVLGIIENMSYIECPDCGKRMNIFGESKIDEVAAELGVPVLAKLGIKPHITELCDAGNIEDLQDDALETVADKLEDEFPGLKRDERLHADLELFIEQMTGRPRDAQ